MAFLEILFLLSNKRVIAIQEFEEDRGDEQSFSTLNANGIEDRGFTRIEGAMPKPIDGILDPARYKMSEDLTALEDWPGYVAVPQRKLQIVLAKQQEINDIINSTNTVDDLKAGLKTILKDLVEKVLNPK